MVISLFGISGTPWYEQIAWQRDLHRRTRAFIDKSSRGQEMNLPARHAAGYLRNENLDPPLPCPRPPGAREHGYPVASYGESSVGFKKSANPSSLFPSQVLYEIMGMNLLIIGSGLYPTSGAPSASRSLTLSETILGRTSK